MQGMMRRSRMWLLAGVSALVVSVFPSGAHSSGTYSPPVVRPESKTDKARLEKAEKLLTEKKRFSAKDAACMDCHGDKSSRAFKRRNLDTVKSELLKQVNKCVTAPERIAGKALVKDDEKYGLAKYFLSEKYRIEFKD